MKGIFGIQVNVPQTKHSPYNDLLTLLTSRKPKSPRVKRFPPNLDQRLSLQLQNLNPAKIFFNGEGKTKRKLNSSTKDLEYFINGDQNLHLPPLFLLGSLQRFCVLLNSGFFSMALALEFASNNVIPRSEFLTIFTPSDSAFSSSGQPSLSLLKFHFSHQSLTSHSLKTLPFNSKIPSLSPSHTLLVTPLPYRDHDFISINGVKVNAISLTYDDKWLRVFGIGKFFDPNFRAPPRPNLDCAASVLDDGDGSMSFGEAIDEIKDKRYSVMAPFLELQLGTTKRPTLPNVFAPQDDKIEGYFSNFSHYMSVFLRYVVPCKMPWSALIDLDYPVAMPTFLEGYEITVTPRQDHGGLLANEVLVIEAVYANEWLAVLGISDVLSAVPEQDRTKTISSEKKINGES